MNIRLLAGIGSLAFSFAASAAPAADLIALVGAVGPPPWQQTILHRAADGGHADVAAWLVAHGARIDARDKYRDTPLHVAVDRGFVEVVELLIAHGASMTSPDIAWGLPMHHLAAFTDVSKGYRSVAAALLAAGADPNASTLNSLINAAAEEQPAVKEARKNRDAIVRLLEAHGATK